MREGVGRFGRLAIVQPRVGIGDMVWHLPHVRALAGLAGHATLVTRRRSTAHQLVGAEEGVHDILWLERGQWDADDARHQGMAGFARLVWDLRRRRFDAAVCLTRSRSVALAVALAGVPARYGFGIGPQRLLQNRGPSLPEGARRLHPFDQAGAWLAAAGVALPHAEPLLVVRAAAAAAVRARLGLAPGSFVAVGIAGSDAWKRWAPGPFAALVRGLLAQGWPGVVLLGGPAERADAEAILGALEPGERALVVPVLGWDLREVAAVLQDAAFYVGTDSAVLNMAAAVGRRAYGLFGGTPVLRHSPLIVPIVPEGGMDESAGMGRIGVGMVLAAVAGEGRGPG